MKRSVSTRIDARLGAGGMGVVYRAHDERLHRTVAIKVIGASGVGSAPEDHVRLLDEARAASHLTHPNICTVYEVGEIGGRPFIAMEFVEGLPLSQMVGATGLPPETVVRYGIQIAAALAHAHERGVVHRDLKTANVVVSPESGAKVLDFGLARRIQNRPVEGVTESTPITEPGLRIGTLAYIAPEILLGQGADWRSDIWGLGVVLYEMATGQLPFQGRNEFDLTAAILRSPARPFPADVPPILRSIILHCLAKEPAQRYQRAGEVRAALEAIQSDLVVVTPEPPEKWSPPGWLVVTGGLAVSAAVFGAWLMLRGRPPEPKPEVSEPATRLTRIESESGFDPAISPDARMVCFVAETEPGRHDLYARRVAGGARIPLTSDAATESSPRFSPDGEQIAYTTRDGPNAVPSVRIVAALGGPVLATIPRASNAAWSPDGRRLAYISRSADSDTTELAISAVDGSDARSILKADSEYPFLRHPAWSPDGSTIAIVRGRGGIAGEVWLLPLTGGPPRKTIDEPQSVFSESPSFTNDGLGLIHASNRGGATNIWMLPLKGGAPVRMTTGPGPDESPTLARDGTLVWVNSRWRNTLELHDLTARSSRTLVTHSPFLWGPAVSPNGTEIAFSRGEVDGAWHIWTTGIDGGGVRQVTSGEQGEVYPRYSADGASLVFHTWNAPRRVYRVPRIGGPLTPVSPGQAGGETFADVSPDGQTIAFVRADAEGERIYIAPVKGGTPRLLTASRGTTPKWSPDGSLIVYAGNRGYSGGIFLIGADGQGERQLAKSGGWPVWWPDGHQIGYSAIGQSANQEIRVLSLRGGATRTLEHVRLVGTNHPFAVFPDGRRLVVSNAVHLSDEIWMMERVR